MAQTQPMTDCVIPLGSGSKHNDLELRYTLRSLEANVVGLREVYVIGKQVPWIKNVVWIGEANAYQRGKQLNIARKLVLGCRMPELTENFLYVHDDHFILQPYTASSFPTYHDLTLQVMYNKLSDHSGYRYSVRNTWEFLKAERKPTRYFDIHCPMVMNKVAFLRLYSMLPETQHGFCLKSAYANFIGIEGEPYTDMKIKERLPIDTLRGELYGRKWFSVGDKGFTPEMQQVLQELFPNPSKYEI